MRIHSAPPPCPLLPIARRLERDARAPGLVLLESLQGGGSSRTGSLKSVRRFDDPEDPEGLLQFLRQDLGGPLEVPEASPDGPLKVVALSYGVGPSLDALASQPPPAGQPLALILELDPWIERTPEGETRVFGSRSDPEVLSQIEVLEDWLASYARTGRLFPTVWPRTATPPRAQGERGALPFGDTMNALSSIPLNLESFAVELPNREVFEASVRAARQAIAQGEVFQVNLAQGFGLGPIPDPVSLYESVRSQAKVDFAGVIRVEDFALLSFSPELLLQHQGRHLVTKPIAGTFPRGKTPAEDEALKSELQAHPKEQAEHVMMVDLLRNDLGRVAVPGSVEVSKMLAVESYPTVHHLVSTIEAEAREDTTLLEALQAVFPGGTITGAPKIRSTQLIAELEAEPRGFYTGSLGFLTPTGAGAWNILIRSLVVDRGIGRIHAGAGIVWDSEPSREYRETVQKVSGLLAAMGHRLPEGSGL